MNESEMTNHIIQCKIMCRQLSIEHWLRYEVFTWQWWVGFAFVVIPFLLWWKLVDRRRLLEIMAFGFLVNIMATFLDVIGTEFVFWNYTIRLLPSVPLFFPVDFVLVPIIFMLIYQCFNAWKPFLMLNTIVALAFSFIVEPLAVYIHQYQLITWKYIYSFPIYVLLAILGKLFADKMSLLQKQSLKAAPPDEADRKP